MMPKKDQRRFWVVATCVALALVWTVGCTALKSKDSADTASGSFPAPAAPTSKEKAPVYYDFGDVMLPSDLKVDKKDSFIMNSGGVTSGILVLKGSLDANSLVGFFESKMPVDGWRKIGRFSSKRSLLVFMKQTRWCVIGVIEGQFGTHVEIWVAPTEKEDAPPTASKGVWK
jgi:hypothetical protein